MISKQASAFSNETFFSVAVTQKREKTKVAAEPKVARVSVLDKKRSQNVGIMIKNLKANNLDLERLEHAVLHVDLTVLNSEIMVKIKEMMVIWIIWRCMCENT
jgi:hypothetical protein